MDATQRIKYGTRISIFGAFANISLFFIKFFIGLLSGSVAVTADSFNNLSDMGSCIVTLVGFKLSGKPADHKHPFGYGRIEYISALIVSIIIIVLGVELIKTSISKILAPDDTIFDFAMISILVITIPMKLFLSYVYKTTGKKINSSAMRAASIDSVNDVIVTSVTIISAVVTKFTGFAIDGFTGVLVASFVTFSGIRILIDTLGPLLGQKPAKEISEEIENRIKSYKEITGIHDMIVHNYGPNKYIASVHAEVPSDADLIKMHDIIDLAEREIYNDMGIIITVHIDPIDTDDSKTSHFYSTVIDILKNIDKNLTMHDFRIVSGETHTNLIFDITVPVNFEMKDENLKAIIDSRIKELHPNCFTIIVFDRPFI